MKLRMTLVIAILSICSYANVDTYYPQEIYNEITTSSIKDKQLIQRLHDVLDMPHRVNSGSRDTLGCEKSPGERPYCFDHKTLGYKKARKLMFGKFYLQEDSKGYFIEDVYCQKIMRPTTPSIKRLGPGMIPNNRVLNCEHTWPQSKFNKNYDRYPKEMQKSDLHHLYPSDYTANGVRGNYPFMNIGNGPKVYDCSASHYLKREGFEPPDSHKGNVARSMFYFSVRYERKIDPEQEAVLKEWHRLDPVDAKERKINDLIFGAQQVRNPFIDFPEIVELISDF